MNREQILKILRVLNEEAEDMNKLAYSGSFDDMRGYYLGNKSGIIFAIQLIELEMHKA